MGDRIFEAFLDRQYEEGMTLAQESDLLELFPLDPQHYIARFHCEGLVKSSNGEIVGADLFEVGVYFPSDYLLRADPFQVLTWFGPAQVFHPNINGRTHVICVGRLTPGMSLVDILYQCFEIITYNKVTMREDDALNREACAWARQNQRFFPIDSRPLKRRAIDIRVEAAVTGEKL